MRQSSKRSESFYPRSKMRRGLRATAEARSDYGELIAMRSVLNKSTKPIRPETITGPGFRNRGRK